MLNELKCQPLEKKPHQGLPSGPERTLSDILTASRATAQAQSPMSTSNTQHSS